MKRLLVIAAGIFLGLLFAVLSPLALVLCIGSWSMEVFERIWDRSK